MDPPILARPEAPPPRARLGLRAALAMEEATHEDASAYIAWHTERVRRTVDLVRQYSTDGERVLDLGAGPLTPQLVEGLRPRAVHVLDPSGRWAQASSSAGAIHQLGSLVDAELPFSPGMFDGVIAAEVFEHLVECPSHIVPKVARILRPGGWFVVTTPNQARWLNRLRLLAGVNIQEAPEHLFHKEWMGYGHIREYTLGEFPHEFGVAGMRPIEVGGWSPHAMPRGDLIRRIIDRVGPSVLDQVLYGVFRKTDGPP